MVYLDKVEINPFEKDKYKDRENYNKFEEYYNILSDCPSIKPSTITPEEAQLVMGLKKYLQEVSIDYEQFSTINGISSTEYLVYESLFGMKKHSKLDFLSAALDFSYVWRTFSDSRNGSDSGGFGGSGGSSGGGGSGFR